jgi:hypothetical protein
VVAVFVVASQLLVKTARYWLPFWAVVAVNIRAG